MEAYEQENSGPITYDDAISSDVTKVSEVFLLSKQTKKHTEVDVDVTKAVQKAKASGWKSLAFRIIETDEEGVQLVFPANVAWGIIFKEEPPLIIE